MPTQTDRLDRGEEARGGESVGRAVEEKANQQVLFREVNEHIAELSGDWSDTGVSLFVCECSDAECAESLEITRGEYEWVRADGACFVVAVGHQQVEVERVVEDRSRFLVVENIGAAAEIARASDPRQHG